MEMEEMQNGERNRIAQQFKNQLMIEAFILRLFIYRTTLHVVTSREDDNKAQRKGKYNTVGNRQVWQRTVHRMECYVG